MTPTEVSQPIAPPDRRQQILDAAMTCFGRRGFHPTTMQDVADEAKVSVGLIYRYFPSKDAVIAEIAREHKADLAELLEQARQAPSLFEAIEIFFTCHHDDEHAQVIAPFVLDLFAESARNAHVRALVRDVHHCFVDGIAELIAASGDAERLPRGFSPRQAAELIVDATHGLMIRDVTELSDLSPASACERQLAGLRSLWTLLFPAAHDLCVPTGEQP